MKHFSKRPGRYERKDISVSKMKARLVGNKWEEVETSTM